MNINKVLFILILFSTCVSAGFGATCKGNNLVYFDLNDKPIIRDCSILHSGQGQVFPGECKTFEGGADCFRLQGNVSVTPAYRDAIRGYTYNTSLSPWDPGFIVSTTTTTLPTVLDCPKCEICETADCSSYEVLIDRLNISNNNNKMNADAYKAQVSSMIDKVAYQNAIQDKNKQINESISQLNQCNKDKKDITGWNNTYLFVAGFSVVIMLVVVVIWIKYEVNGPKLDDPFCDKPKKK